MLCSIKIDTQDNSETIEIGKAGESAEKDLITDINIRFDTINDDVLKKSNAMLAKIKVKGRIDEPIKDELKALFNWAKDGDSSKWYRNIEIKIKSSMDDVYRTYSFPNVFVVDYFEFYKNDAQQDKTEGDYFELYLTQKENNFKEIACY